MATLLKTSDNGTQVGPGSKFYVVLKLYKVSDTGTGYKMYLNRSIQVIAGTNGFGGTNVATSWGTTVSLSGSGNYGSSNSGEFTVAYGSTYNSGVQYAQYTSGSGNTYKSTASLSYTVPKPTYTVSYNANGGSGAPSNQTKTYGANLILSSTEPTKTGYIFKGWATSATGDPVYYPGSVYSTNAAMTLYAVWQTATLIRMSLSDVGSYYISNGSTGKAILSNIGIPFNLITTEENSTLDLYYDIYYSYNGTLKRASTDTITIKSGKTSGTIILKSTDIKEYIKTLDNISSLNIVIKTYTGEISEDTLSTYNMNISIAGYSKISVKEIQTYRKLDGSVSLKVIMSYPVSYDASKCVPDIYFNNTFLGVTPSSSIKTLDSSNPTENLRQYEYILSSTQTSGGGTVTIKYDDGLFVISDSGIVASSIEEQIIYINKNGSVQGFEFLEKNIPEVCFYRDGSVRSFEFIENDESAFSIGSNGQITTFEIIEV